MTYTLTFTFVGSSPPNPSDLFLVVLGLGCQPNNAKNACDSTKPFTTAQITTWGVTTSAPGNIVGEFGEGSTPASSSGFCLSPTAFNPITLTFSSGYTGPCEDALNTGWDLYQANSPNTPNFWKLTLQVNQIRGDGIGFTLGYRVCPALVGTLDFFFGGMRLASPIPYSLYDISPTTGAATNPRPTSGNSGIASSPVLPNGTLYEVTLNGEVSAFYSTSTTVTIVPPPITGLTSNVGASSYSYELAADLTSGTLYALDAIDGGILWSDSSGTMGKLGLRSISYPLGSPALSTPSFTGMAFDDSGNLFVVDAANSNLLELSAADLAKPVLNNPTVVSLAGLPQGKFPGAFAIDPYGAAYYAAADGLYTVNITYDLYGNLQPATLTWVGYLVPTAYPSPWGVHGLTSVTAACPVPGPIY